MQNKEIIREKIINTAKQQGKKQSDIIRNCNLNPTFMQDIKKSYMRIDKISEIADYLDISVDYLLGRTDDMYSHKK